MSSQYHCIKCDKEVIVTHLPGKTYSPNAVELISHHCYGNHYTDYDQYCYICNECYCLSVKNKNIVHVIYK